MTGSGLINTHHVSLTIPLPKNHMSSRIVLAILAALAASFLVLSSSLSVPLFLLAASPRTSTVKYTSVPLSTEQKEHLKRLGLTPKNPVNITDPLTGATRTIHGRFVHITDMHPDSHYKPGSLHDEMCHSGKGESGKYGDAILGCDSPMELVEETIDWVADNLKDKVDFIVWTGDNMRHDNDRKHPRTELSIFEMNEIMANMMHDKFGTLPIPSLGNNDVFPHNLFAPGPTLQTREFFKVWQKFIPQLQLHIFNSGAYFFQEVIPNQLAVLSINTLYLFQSNPLVDSCDRKKDPGYKLFLWLGNVLKEMRKRKMKVWLTGHVPPNAKNYDISCLRKYIAWTHEFRDVIVGGLYGHMNIDHFIPLDSVQAYKSLQKKFKNEKFDFSTFDDDISAEEIDDTPDLELEDLYKIFNSPIYNDDADSELGFNFDFSNNVRIEGGIPSGKVEYLESLREAYYANVKGIKKSGKNSERYSIVHVTASVVPTFNPGVRVWEYNITELCDIETLQVESWDDFFTRIDGILDADDDSEDEGFSIFKKKKKDKTFPPKMPADAKLGPGYVPQLFTPERYVQYYLDLDAVNKGDKKFEYEIEYCTDDPFLEMKDSTVGEWLKMARELGDPIKRLKKNKAKKGKDEKREVEETKKSKDLDDDFLEQLWELFLQYTFVSSGYEHRGYG